jgi:glucan biosynthesis protein C
MATKQNRFVYLDNIRNILVYNVVLLHVIPMFAYPLLFWWPVIDKEGSSIFYETGIASMSIYMMPCLLFIAALFIFPSLKKGTTIEYIKNRFLRLCVPVIVFLFCAGDIFFQLRLTRLNSVSPTYLETFLNFWRSFINMPGIYVVGSEKTLNAVWFDFGHTWFLTLLFFMTLIIILLSLPFRRKNSEQEKVDSRKIIILQTIIFAVALGIVYTAALLYYVIHGLNSNPWLIIGKAVQLNINQIWTLLPMFLFGLYVYKKEWLTRGDIGNWKMWGVMSFIFLALYVLLYHIGFMPVLEEILKVVEHDLLFDNEMAMPVENRSFQLAALCTWLLLPMACVFLLMFFLSFAKRFFNKPNAITAFCSKHSINVYILHYAPVLILQYALLNVPITPIVKIILMTIIIIPACLWLSHRLVYPYPKIAIAFFVALKLVALAAGFTFYYFALLALIFISFAGAVYESVRYMVAQKASLKPA